MAYVSLYRKYRSQTFDELIGQEHISRTLKNALAEGRVAHAYLFTGPRGTGKTSTARILAKALNCVDGPTPEPCGKCESCVAITQGSSLDVFELDAASHSGVDETREILSGVPLATAGGRKKVYVIDEVHMLTTQSFNALLKTLEEPPEHVVFVLATTDPHKVLPTIVSRTQRFDFRRISVEALETHLAGIAEREGIEIDPDALTVVARHADGSARDALSALDQLSSLEGRVAVEDAERLLGDRDDDAMTELFDAIAANDVGGVFSKVHSVVAQGADPRQLAFGAMERARELLLLSTAPDAESLIDAADGDRATLVLQAERFLPEGLVRILDLLGKSITEMRNAPNHRLLLEVALVRAAAPETDPAATGLLGRIERLERRIGIEGAGALPAEPPAARTGALPAEPAAAKGASSPRRPALRGSVVQETAKTTRPAPKQEPAPTPAPAPATGVPDQVGLGDIKEAWVATLGELKKSSVRVAAMLNPSRPLGYSEGRLEVGVQSQYHADEMSVAANMSLLAEALHAALGVRPQLAFTAQGAGAKTPRQDIDETIDVAADATPIQNDPVELVRKGLGAEVVEEKMS